MLLSTAARPVLNAVEGMAAHPRYIDAEVPEYIVLDDVRNKKGGPLG